MKFDPEQLEAAAQRLEADQADSLTFSQRAGLVHRIVADIRVIAGSNGATRSGHPKGHAYIDGILREALSQIVSMSGPEQLLIAESWHARLIAAQAEAEAFQAEEAEKRRRRADEERFGPQRAACREARRDAWVRHAMAPALNMIERCGFRVAAAQDAMRLVQIDDEDGIEPILAALAECGKDVTNAVGIARREARIRRAASDAEKAVASALAA